MQFLEELWKMCQNIEILDLTQQKEEWGYLVLEPTYHATKFFTENVLAIEMKKKQTLINESFHLDFSILELSKMLMHEFWYNYVKPKYGEKGKLCDIDADSFIVQIKTEEIYKYIAEDVETRFDTSNYELGKPLPKGKSKKVIGLMKGELGGEILAKLRLRDKIKSKNLQLLNR